MPRPQPRSRRVPSRGQEAAAEELEVEGVVAQLAAGELPVEHAGFEVGEGGVAEQGLLGGVGLPAERQVPGDEGEGEGEHAADEGAAEEEIQPRLLEAQRLEIGEADVEIARAAQAAAGLQLGEEEEGAEAGEADVGREVGEGEVQPEPAGEEEAERQVEAVERTAADEDAERHRRRLLPRRGRLGAQLEEEVADLAHEAARGLPRLRWMRLRRLRHLVDHPPESACRSGAGPAAPGAPADDAGIATERNPRSARAASTGGRAASTTGLPPPAAARAVGAAVVEEEDVAGGEAVEEAAGDGGRVALDGVEAAAGPGDVAQAGGVQHPVEKGVAQAGGGAEEARRRACGHRRSAPGRGGSPAAGAPPCSRRRGAGGSPCGSRRGGRGSRSRRPGGGGRGRGGRSRRSWRACRRRRGGRAPAG